MPAASLGVGANWGGGQGLSGSIQASLFTANVYADTNGNFSAGVGIGPVSFATGKKPKYKISRKVPIGDDDSYAKIGYSTDGSLSLSYKGAKGFVGMSFSGSGNFSIGGLSKGGVGANFSKSSSSESAGDATVDTKSIGLSVTVPIGPLAVSLGYRRTKVKISILKGYENREWGALYASDYSSFTNPELNNSRKALIEGTSFSGSRDGFYDYMFRGNQLDSYSTRLPQSEEEFVGDYSKEIENLNFTFIAYDDYSVAAQGMMGSLTPYVFQNANIIGKGTRTSGANDNELIHAFFHHGEALDNVNRRLAPTGGQKPFEFYFNGQITKTEENDASVLNATNNLSLNMNDLLSEGLHYGQAIGNNRAHQGNYVEVFTNQEIKNNQAQGLITPKDIPNSSRNNTALFDPDGIGAYKITAADGKTYHFSLPVYHYERVYRKQLEHQEFQQPITMLNIVPYDCADVQESRQYHRYATHWLLTAVTGPDYFDANSNGYPDKEDYGYWVELEYGKWSDGYVWRTPHQDFVYDYSTNIQGDIETEDKGHYQFGRKQVYYLDKINTKNRTALFVKDIRYDAYGKELTFRFKNRNRSGNSNVGHSGHGQDDSSLNFTNPNVHVKEDGVHYKREYSLRLDKIILIDSDDNSLINEGGTSNLGSSLPSYTANDTSSPNWASPLFEEHYGANYSYGIHLEENILDAGDLPANFVQQHAIKVIQFNQGYNLVKNTPSSMINGTTYGGNDGAARLTLNGVTSLGRGGTSFMPPTSFHYYNSNTITNPNFPSLTNDDANSIRAQVAFRKNFVDPWGYMQNTYQENGITYTRAQLWSLKEITTPTGATVKINYEEDDYWTEAFSRRYWHNSGLKAKFTEEGGVKYIYFKQNFDEITNETINFKDYFTAGENVFLDTHYYRNPSNSSCANCSGRIADFAGEFPIEQLTETYIKIRLPQEQNSTYREDGNNTCDSYPWSYTSYYECNCHQDVVQWFADIGDSEGYVGYWNSGGGLCGFRGRGQTLFKYKLLANKVPEDETGGGLRVKEIVTRDGNSTYKASYDYTHPTKLNNDGNPRSSGITSYAPVDGVKYVPYQSEVPPPGVMYEYVTVAETDANGNYNLKRRYRNYVLKPLFNIFNPEITLDLIDSQGPDEDNLFWVEVTEPTELGLDGNNPKKVEAKKIDVHINTALFGQLKSIETLNSEGHIMDKVENYYANGRNLSNNHSEKAYVKETFNSLKSIFVTNKDGTTVDNNKTKRLLSISSKTEYKNVLKSSTSYYGGHTSSVTYSDIDPWLGSFRKKETKLADGTSIFTTKIPAYTKYLQMGSKVDDPTYKNMLTQQTMSLTTTSSGTLNASISTWNDTWTYRDPSGNETTESDVWRKQGSYVWKDAINPSTGAYATAVSENNDYFDWVAGTPTSDKWQKVSEITQYTHWSNPLETKDINGNFASTRMADDYNKVIATANARQSEMYYSGAEHVASGNTFEGEVLGANYRTNEVSHTGEYAVKNNQAGNKVFQVTGNVGVGSNDLTKEFRPGTYKVSFWSHVQKGVDYNVVKLGNRTIPLAETVVAGCWQQFNYYVKLRPNTTVDLYVTNTIGGGFYFDDFRMHPVYASMSSYVYDQETDELTYILNGNNMGSAFRYDDAGRLITTYTEVETTSAFEGGFKIISQNKYNYLDTPVHPTYNVDINRCIEQVVYPALKINSLNRTCMSQLENTYTVDVTGGSGNYQYEWRGLIDAANDTYSSYQVGGQSIDIPYAVVMCDENNFNKKWAVQVRVTDTQTNEVIEQSASNVLSGCSNYLSREAWGNLSVSYCLDLCKEGYTFSIHPTNPNKAGKYTYEYIYTNPTTGETSEWIDVTGTKGKFCPTIFQYPWKDCKSGYVNHVRLGYRITDLTTGEVYATEGVTHNFYLGCAESEGKNAIPEKNVNENLNKHIKNNVLIILDAKGNISSVKSTNEEINQKK